MSKQEYITIPEYDIVDMNSGEVITIDAESFDNMVSIGAIDTYTHEGNIYFNAVDKTHYQVVI